MEIARYVLPSLSAMVVSYTYSVVDGIFVGQGVGENALASVNLAVPFTEIMTALASMLTVGGATVMAIRKGRGENVGANNAFLISTVLVLMSGIALTLVGVLFPHGIAKAFGATESLIGGTTEYIRWYSAFSIFFTLSILGSAFVRNDGSPGLVFWGMVFGAIANIFLDWLFVFPLQMGLKGAAIASGLGQIVSCVILSVHFIRKKGILRFKRFHVQAALIKKVFMRGLPEFVIQMSQPITIYCYNRVILQYLGELGLAAFSACSYLLMIASGIFLGVSQGVQPLLGKSFGKKHWEDLKYFFHAALIINFTASVLLYVIYVVFGKPILSLFITDVALIPTAYTTLRYYGFSILPASINMIYITYFLSTKNTSRALTISCSRGVVFNSICIFAIPVLFGGKYIWFPMIVAEAITLCIAFVIKLRYDRKFKLVIGNHVE